MHLHTCPALEDFLTEKDHKPDLYILLDGKLQIKNKAREDYIIDPYDIFGYTSIFTKKSWIPGKVSAKENSTLVSISRENLKKLMQNVEEIQENSRLIEFLAQSVPGVKQLGQAGKDRILSFFQKIQFKSGEYLLREGEVCDYAYIIESGECKLVSIKNPGIIAASVHQGLISRTTSCFNIGMATVGEWVGDDSVILNKRIEFSAIAAVNVVALQISRQNFLESLGRETQNALKIIMERKIKWRKERKRNISHTIAENVADNSRSESIDIEKAERKYPVASKSTLKFIRKRQKAEADREVLLNSREKSSSNLRYSALPVRPQSNMASNNHSRSEVSPEIVNFLSVNNSVYQNMEFEHQTHRPSPSIKLYSASTLGYSMVPVLPMKTNIVKKKNSRIVENLKKNRGVSGRNDNLSRCYGERIRNGRPSSPNPAEIWAKQHNVKLSK